MAIGTALALGLGGALLGGVAGAIPKKSEETSGLTLGGASGLEQQGYAATGSNFSQLQAMLSGGPNSQDYQTGTQAQRDFADMLGRYSQSGGSLPTQADLDSSNVFAQRAYDPQRVALGQSFEDQKTEAARLSAQLGRPVDDPILQAKLRTGFMRQSASLQAEQSAFANQFAMQQPGQRLGYAGQRAGVLDELGQRAASNRSLLLSLGSQIMGGERNFRVQTAERYGKGQSGGGLGGAIGGALGGFGGGLSAFTAGQNAGLFGGGGGGGFQSASPFSYTPAQTYQNSGRSTGLMPR